ncbi:NAD(P)-binding domain-containing protein [Haloglycomyces albus]|uniref:NAD(P)-binding domain-containing protein n=1 Tax=Haloglycomyces albus TaxID=526067 RepID=UPI00046C8D7D|nr:NAD(P)-binding domain-containing protein [Haloglycomyces albus]
MPTIGIIGVGEIGKAIVTGLCEDRTHPPQIFLSPRGRKTTDVLAHQYETVTQCPTNQAVVDNSDTVILAVRPHDRADAFDGLTINGPTVLVNVMAGVGNADVRRELATDTTVVRAIPLPAVRERRAITVISPNEPNVNALFASLGGALAVASERELNVFSALTATLSSHYRFLTTIAAWATSQGISPNDADRYIRGLFQGIGRALGDESRSLTELAADHETPQGINERLRTEWFDSDNVDSLTAVLDQLLKSFPPRQ